MSSASNSAESMEEISSTLSAIALSDSPKVTSVSSDIVKQLLAAQLVETVDLLRFSQKIVEQFLLSHGFQMVGSYEDLYEVRQILRHYYYTSHHRPGYLYDITFEKSSEGVLVLMDRMWNNESQDHASCLIQEMPSLASDSLLQDEYLCETILSRLSLKLSKLWCDFETSDPCYGLINPFD